ncbi:beta-glucosidase-like glycosyl hydrolase [Beggiatoa alba B18LD]|uniref:Beta-hexosaminidase n=1 Tax=Beggiatoa alba B18LD TaxID=395493 RepID=I3CJQ6_9GAMM|nr:beta-N-acetylhexosaminidase [Beggiatoa alba]EIJ43849.1 beta-glucosidase-like glycosyl hydrolase [Beggiatoa alba B18LD]
MALGHLMIDLEGLHLTTEERELLQHPLVGGVILFSRNYESLEQVSALTAEIHALRTPPLLIAVDHEGGRVQRFREGFTRLPACARLGQLYDQQPRLAKQAAEQMGWLMASELRTVGIDFSFAPVVDLGKGVSTVIGDRALHHDPDIITTLAQAMISGMRQAGMAAVAKHFPGHGSVVADSHHEVPIDTRDLTDIQFTDLIPFARLIKNDLAGIMPAHVIYPKIDEIPTGFSPRWLQRILRQELGFQGVIFSDDVSMAGATVMGDVVTRTQRALQAGCDMILICQDRKAVIQVLEQLAPYHSPVSQARLIRMHGQKPLTRQQLQQMPQWETAKTVCLNLEKQLDINVDTGERLA